jgi:mannan endo-1,6-alpha-mannosidase
MTALVTPYTDSDIVPLLHGSAVGAAKKCTGDKKGTECGMRWYTGEYYGFGGIPSQLSTTNIFTANLVSLSNKAPSTQADFNKTTPSTTGSATSTSSGAADATTTGANAASVLAVGPAALAAAVIAGAVALF